MQEELSFASHGSRLVRVLALMDSLARASFTLVPLRMLHELAYLSNVLAPVFDLPPLSASLLKRRGGPHYVDLQHAVDKLVGRGIVHAIDIRYVHIPEEARYSLDARYRLNRLFADPILERYRELYQDSGDLLFLDELAGAYSTLTNEQLGRAALQDARYADQDVDNNNVIDFGQWTDAAKTNFAHNAAMSFAASVNLHPAERLYMYMDHLRKRAASGA